VGGANGKSNAAKTHESTRGSTFILSHFWTFGMAWDTSSLNIKTKLWSLALLGPRNNEDLATPTILSQGGDSKITRLSLLTAVG